MLNTKAEYNALLVANICVVEFEKKDGTIRTMLCTLKPELVEKHTPKSATGKVVTVPEHQVRCVDIEIGEWRSFNIPTVKHFAVIK